MLISRFRKTLFMCDIRKSFGFQHFLFTSQKTEIQSPDFSHGRIIFVLQADSQTDSELQILNFSI